MEANTQPPAAGSSLDVSPPTPPESSAPQSPVPSTSTTAPAAAAAAPATPLSPQATQTQQTPATPITTPTTVPSNPPNGSSKDTISLNNVITYLTTENAEPTNIVGYLRSVASKDVGETILASLLAGGQDPLDILNPVQNTLGYLFILSARVSFNDAPPLQTAQIEQFCINFDEVQARLAPERVTMLAKGLLRLAEASNAPQLAILPLRYLTTRYPPTPSHLTTLHPIFVRACNIAGRPIQALPILNNPIIAIDTSISDLTAFDNVQYHYEGALSLLDLEKWELAEEFLEICVTSPIHSTPLPVQVEALKKLTLVQLIAYGKTRSLPKYTHPNLGRAFKNSPYSGITKSYPQVPILEGASDKDVKAVQADGNLDLVREANVRITRWKLKELTGTYACLTLGEVAEMVKAEQEVVRELVHRMVEEGALDAAIDEQGTITFADELAKSAALSSKEAVQKVLKDAEVQGQLLEQLDKELSRNKDFLMKALKGRDEGLGVEDMELYNAGSKGQWDDNAF
ncbi:hypothetical protein SISSUDRAFT_1028642 [Sistotremastrum suecicum HHB10207 ss-3]|uniref:COP9 signalosome complex subunit 3 N-terminal helical repeats domain-containing protein n=1 Tax=Sistotremastrum suecicum HHB10207 ss-3 TaxID=1314776 RepID=A0A165XJS4_9AGAM|nr:hypothetical protein SISSUDRAFT_1028642 [Sistotremastrum suecicum HHB10207 ss-3]